MLEVGSLVVRYGAVQALHGIALEVGEGEIVCLLGPNGAGKSTTLRTIVGLQPAADGSVVFDGRSVLGWPPEAIVRRGLTLVPEGRRIFAELTVAENLALGAAIQRDRNAVRRQYDEVFALFPVLAERRGQPGGSLSGGEQQQLAVARALMAGPRLLLLDEPTLGLAPRFVESILEMIVALRAGGRTILLVEQNVDLALDIADRGYVLAGGRSVLSGSAARLAESEQVREVYLGVGE